jgi:hypothetical protein
MTDEHASSIEQAVERLVETAESLPGTFSPEVALWFFPGVITKKRWACEVEADIYGNHFTVWGLSPEEAIDLGVAEAWRRVPNGSNAELEITGEWYWRDGWLLASVFLAGGGAVADLADVIGATRRASNPSVFMNREEFGWAASRLIESGMLEETVQTFLPSAAATELWAAATTSRPELMGSEFTRSLLREMQASGIEATGEVRMWSLADAEYLSAIRTHIERRLKDPGS